MAMKESAVEKEPDAESKQPKGESIETTRGSDELAERVEVLPGIYQKDRTHFPIYEKVMMRATWVVTWIPLVMILVLLAMTFADVVLRKLFKSGVYGMYDYTGYILVLITAFAFMLTTMNDEQIEINLLFNLFPKKMKSVITVANYLFVGWLCWLQFSGNIAQSQVARMVGLRPMGLWFPQWPFYIFIGIGFFLILLVIVIKLLNHIRGVK